jgi:hypothetical protein
MATVTPEQMEKVHSHIQCDQIAEVFENEWVIYNPKPSMLIIMRLLEIVTYTDCPEEANKYITKDKRE